MKAKPREKFKKIVIYGGSFSPPHRGHAAVIETVLRSFPCDELWLMPSSDRLDKRMTARGEDRVEMLRIMLQEWFPEPAIPIVIATLELERHSLTTTYETLAELRGLYPKGEFYFLLGSDILPDVPTKWVKGKELWESAHFIIFQKSELAPDRLPPASTIIKSKKPPIEISSTKIRELIARGHVGLPHIPQGVADYIRQKDLYRRR